MSSLRLFSGCAERVSTHPPEKTFLQRLLETGATESSTSAGDSNFVEVSLASRRASTVKTLTYLVQAIDVQRARAEELASSLRDRIADDGKYLAPSDPSMFRCFECNCLDVRIQRSILMEVLSRLRSSFLIHRSVLLSFTFISQKLKAGAYAAAEAGRLLKKEDLDLRAERAALRRDMEELILKYKKVADELRAREDTHAKDQSEIARLTSKSFYSPGYSSCEALNIKMWKVCDCKFLQYTKNSDYFLESKN